MAGEPVGQTHYTGLPGSRSIDEVRFYVGDTDARAYLLSDQEITFALSVEGSAKGAAALCAESLSARFAREHDHSTQNMGATTTSESKSQVAKQFAELAKRLRSSASATAVPLAGGISQADKATAESDTDRVAAPFWRGQFDNVGDETSPESVD